MKQITPYFIVLLGLSTNAFSSNVIPMGVSGNSLYYKMGGGHDFALPPVSDTTTVRVGYNANLGWGNSCSNFNPALSIVNTINDIKDSADNLEQSVVANATGSLIQSPMYFLAQANPTAYNILNNGLISGNQKIQFSTKSCQIIQDQISDGKNPYSEWGTLSVGDTWKKHLSLGNEDINHVKKEIDINGGDDGVSWVQGKRDGEGVFHAGGKDQPPISVIADASKAGFNAMLNRDLQSNNVSSGEMLRYFKNPQDASSWITSVVGDAVITTCKDDSCKKSQASLVGHGLLPSILSCEIDKDNCESEIGEEMMRLVSGAEPVTKENLLKVSSDGVIISPEIINNIRMMDAIQKEMIIVKLSQEVSVQRIIDKTIIAKDILKAGSQVPAISSNHPAQVLITKAIKNLDDEIQSLNLSRKIRKENVSDTITAILNDANKKQMQVRDIPPVNEATPVMENGALPKV